ncbi:unnamed protein product [Caenorhabditis angaria]|uniref:AAA+ ATPase domain-containing protein n=1 Tax=Caenorhabditis angaria TaxID=860376 RepID=A0A9P1I5D3_9PELO|nr:unnamed protein product [Caenorhabditis angaria]
MENRRSTRSNQRGTLVVDMTLSPPKGVRSKNIKTTREETVTPVKKLKKGKTIDEEDDVVKKLTPKLRKMSCSTSKDSETDEISSSCSKNGALKGREDEFDSIKNWIFSSQKNKKPVSIYISGQPGTGKTATTKRVLESMAKHVHSCIVNCASVSTKSALLSNIFKSQDYEGRATQENLNENLKSSSKCLVLVLDEIDHLVSRTNSTLYSAFQWPYSLSYRIVIIGIANSIDLTERLLPKLMLSQPPERLVFEPYSKDSIVKILTDKINNEDNEIDGKAVELCARKVAAMSGDLRTALHIFKQTKHRMNEETESGTPKKDGCREVLGIMKNVYSSPLARAKLPLQPRILLAVSLALSNSKKANFNRDSLMKAYMKTCEAIRAPQMDDEDILAAFQTLESQSFLRQLPDNSMLDQISLLNF